MDGSGKLLIAALSIQKYLIDLSIDVTSKFWKFYLKHFSCKPKKALLYFNGFPKSLVRV